MKDFETSQEQRNQIQKDKTGLTITTPISDLPYYDIFSEANTKCIKSNQALYACTQLNCTSPNPYICNIEQCQCTAIHFDCTQKKVQSLIKAVHNRRNQFTQTQNLINQVLDQVNLNFSARWDQVIHKFQKRTSGFGALFDKSQEQQELTLALTQNKLTGSLLSRIFDTRKLQEQTLQQKQLVSKIKRKAKEFQQKQLTNFFNQIQLQLFDKPIQFHPKMLNKTLERVSHLRLRCTTHQIDDNFSLGLIQPTINQMLKGEHKIIKWQVKIHFITHWIGIGICLKRFLERKDFNFNNYQIADHGSYIISSNEFLWTHRNKDRNFKKDGAFKLIMGDVINVRLDMRQREITFSNERLNKETTLKITYDPESEDEYCITLGMYQEGDEAQILEPIKVYSEQEDQKDRKAESNEVKRKRQPITVVGQPTDSEDSFIVQSDTEYDQY